MQCGVQCGDQDWQVVPRGLDQFAQVDAPVHVDDDVPHPDDLPPRDRANQRATRRCQSRCGFADLGEAVDRARVRTMSIAVAAVSSFATIILASRAHLSMCSMRLRSSGVGGVDGACCVSNSGGIENPRAGQHCGLFVGRDSTQERQVDCSPKELRKVHLQPAQREKPRRTERISLDENVDVAVGTEPIGQDGAEQEQAYDASPAARGVDSRKIESNVVQTEHRFHCIAPIRRLHAPAVTVVITDHRKRWVISIPPVPDSNAKGHLLMVDGADGAERGASGRSERAQRHQCRGNLRDLDAVRCAPSHQRLYFPGTKPSMYAIRSAARFRTAASASLLAIASTNSRPGGIGLSCSMTT